MEETINLIANIRYGVNYTIDLYREDRDSWIRVQNPNFSEAMRMIADAIKEQPEEFIMYGDMPRDVIYEEES